MRAAFSAMCPAMCPALSPEEEMTDLREDCCEEVVVATLLLPWAVLVFLARNTHSFLCVFAFVQYDTLYRHKKSASDGALIFWISLWIADHWRMCYVVLLIFQRKITGQFIIFCAQAGWFHQVNRKAQQFPRMSWKTLRVPVRPDRDS